MYFICRYLFICRGPNVNDRFAFHPTRSNFSCGVKNQRQQYRVRRVVVFCGQDMSFLVTRYFSLLRVGLLNDHVRAFRSCVRISEGIALFMSFRRTKDRGQSVVRLFKYYMGVRVRHFTYALFTNVIFYRRASFLKDASTFILNVDVDMSSASAHLKRFLCNFPDLLYAFRVVSTINIPLSGYHLHSAFCLFPISLSSKDRSRRIMNSLSIVFNHCLVPCKVSNDGEVFGPFSIVKCTILLLSPSIVQLVCAQYSWNRPQLVGLAIAKVSRDSVQLIRPALWANDRASANDASTSGCGFAFNFT